MFYSAYYKYRKLCSFLSRFNLETLKIFGLLCGKRIYLTYNNRVNADGLGAQLQRQISVCAISNYLGLNFVFSPITSITIHPLDGISDYSAYLQKANDFFDFNNFIKDLDISKSNVHIYLKKINFLGFLKYFVLSIA